MSRVTNQNAPSSIHPERPVNMRALNTGFATERRAKTAIPMKPPQREQAGSASHWSLGLLRFHQPPATSGVEPGLTAAPQAVRKNRNRLPGCARQRRAAAPPEASPPQGAHAPTGYTRTALPALPGPPAQHNRRLATRAAACKWKVQLPQRLLGTSDHELVQAPRQARPRCSARQRVDLSQRTPVRLLSAALPHHEHLAAGK